MENLFLGIIAFNALLSALIIGGLAIGMRMVHRKLDDLEADVEREVMPKVQEFAELARKIASATADARQRVARADVVVTARADQVQRLLGGTLERVADVAEQAASFAGEAESEEDEEEFEAAR